MAGTYKEYTFFICASCEPLTNIKSRLNMLKGEMKTIDKEIYGWLRKKVKLSLQNNRHICY